MKYAFTLVHGTFARGAPWTRDDSALVGMLRARFGDDAVIRPFLWSGRNSHEDRMSAGHALSAFIERCCADHPERAHFVIAHSHGGNIAVHAAWASGNPTPLAGIACLATPFLCAAPRRVSAMVTAARLAAPVIGGLVAIAIAALILILSARYLGTWLQTVPDWFVLVPLVLFANLIIRLPAALQHASRGLGGVLRRHRRRLVRPLRPTRPITVPILVATYPQDEARWWLRRLSAGASIPFRLWNGPSRLANGLMTIRRWGPPALVAFGIGGSVAVRLYGETGAQWLLSGAGLVIGVYQFYLTMAFLLVVAMIVLSKFLRSHPFGYGWESVLRILLVRTETVEVPSGATAVTRCTLPEAPSWRRGLRHSRIYGEPDVLRQVGNWLEGIGGKAAP